MKHDVFPGIEDLIRKSDQPHELQRVADALTDLAALANNRVKALTLTHCTECGQTRDNAERIRAQYRTQTASAKQPHGIDVLCC